ncbi:hypothetical protein [Chamaesiphon sp. OTE_75_metabat_556]|uniref:hypothetical protein n=1 Tax=Chamaesiphon sp. OTE_75_metabat_556 TaxID=2964692 RepID=UPI00286BB7FA|nr:hypothetical protein [Chamaesiphon sp. OTE_75_metabat_556]
MINSALSDETKQLAAGYVLDELEPSEIEAFERMMLEDATLRQEVRELQMILGGLTLDVPQLQPPTHLRARVLQSSDINREVIAVPPKKRNWTKVVTIFALNNQQVIYCGEFRTDGQGNASQSINPPQVPPPGTKATGLFVTVDRENAPVVPIGTRIISGEI